MIVRPLSCLAIAVSLAGCAGERMSAPMGLGYHGGDLDRAAVTQRRVPDTWGTTVAPKFAAPVPGTPMKQTLGGKVLSAIAFERVTGMKADPSRLNDLR